MGMNLENMSKMFKCAGNDDVVTLKADDGSDTVTFMFESPSEFYSLRFLHLEQHFQRIRVIDQRFQFVIAEMLDLHVYLFIGELLGFDCC